MPPLRRVRGRDTLYDMDPNQPSQPFDPDATTLGPPVPAPSARAMLQPQQPPPGWPNPMSVPTAGPAEAKKSQRLELSLILFLAGLIGLLAFAALYILQRL